MSVLSRFLNLFRSASLQRDLDDEVRFHVESRTASNLRAGMTRLDAETSARAAFGDVRRITEDMREARAMTWVESLVQDLRYGARSLARERLPLVAVLAMLALGIGANVAIFTVLNAVWLRPLPYPDAARLVTIEDAFVTLGIPRTQPTVPEFLDVRRWNRSFDTMAFLDHRDLQLAGSDEPARVVGARVTAPFFSLLGATPALGRLFGDADNQPGNDQVVVLSHGTWQRAFGSDATVVGRAITLDSRPHVVVGVLPAGFGFDHPGIGVRERVDVYVPFLLDDYYTLRSGSHSHLRRVLALGRLAAGTSIESANAELAVLGQRLASTHPDLYRSQPSGEDMGFTMRARPLQEAIVGDTRTVLLLLLASVGCILLIVCANTAQFLLARSLQRRHEVAIRLSLGASPRRLVQQFLAEAALLALAGGVLGLWSARLMVRALLALTPSANVLTSDVGVVRIDATVMAFALGLSMFTAVLFGLLPALSAAHSTRRVVRGAAAGSQPRYLLIALEVGLSVVLLAGAAVLVRGLMALSSAPLGFSPDDVTVMQLRLTQPRPELQRNASLQYEAYLEALRQVPGVDSAAVQSGQPVPLTDASFVIGAHAGDANALARQTARLIVSPDYFRVLRVPLVAGRTFTTADTPDRPPVAIVNEEVARALWPNESAVGKQLRVPRPTTIVGVVGNTRTSPARTQMTPQIYVPSLQMWEPNARLVVRTVAGTAAPLQAYKRAIWSVAPTQAVFNIRSMNQMLATATAEPRFRTSLVGSFALLALVLSAAGIYGLVSYLVSQRTREIAIRVAVGAQRRNVYWTVSRQTMLSTCAGLGAGIAAALALWRVVGSSLSTTVSPDAATITAVSALYLAVALLATYVPARRAFNLDAMRALKPE
jgi:putative ABC transport system permease protein